MLINQQLLILNFQILAGLLMGLDYLMPESWRENMNKKTVIYFSNMQEGIDSDIINTWEYVKANRTMIIVSSFMVCSSIIILNFTDQSIFIGHYILFFLWLIAIVFLLLIGVISLLRVAMNIIVPVSLGGIFRLFTTFILFSPKGPLAAIGFLCLCTSFFLRYKTLTI